MNYLDLRDLTRRQPFRPFRIRLDDGRHFDLRHLEQFLLTLTTLHVGLPAGESEQDVGRVEYVDLHHIVSYEELSEPARTKGNGQGQ